MATAARTYEEIALAEIDRQWELYDGTLREKPRMSIGHGYALRMLDDALHDQLDRRRYRISVNTSRLRAGDDVVYIPDLVVIPVAFERALRARPDALEVYAQAMPFVVEIWSPSTGAYDIETKIPAYQARGDVEIWRLHPCQRTLTVWRRREDGGYDRTVHRAGSIRLTALPNVVIDLDALFV